MLPPDAKWIPRHQHAKDEIALTLGGKMVAMLMQNNVGGWYARLECHWPIVAPVVMRDCRSFETGKAGCETWLARHEARIRDEIANPHKVTAGRGEVGEDDAE